jgi:hypothetical protein
MRRETIRNDAIELTDNDSEKQDTKPPFFITHSLPTIDPAMPYIIRYPQSRASTVPCVYPTVDRGGVHIRGKGRVGDAVRYNLFHRRLMRDVYSAMLSTAMVQGWGELTATLMVLTDAC